MAGHNNEYLDNIRSVWDRSDAIDRGEGMIAYNRYRATLSRLANYYSQPLPSVVGMFCALSPNNSYMTNLRSTKAIIEGKRGAGYTACRDRARRCLNGENFLEFTKGLKTRNFYMNIMNPYDPGPVTIDGHAYSIWSGKYHTMKSVARLKFKYHEVADGYRQMAKLIGVLPCQLQAVTWFTWKRIHNAVYNPQMDMFWPDDHWGLDLQPHEIAEFCS